MQKRDVDLMLRLLCTQERKRIIREIQKEDTLVVQGFTKSPSEAPVTKLVNALYSNPKSLKNFVECIVASANEDKTITNEEMLSIQEPNQLVIELARIAKTADAIPDEIFSHANSLLNKTTASLHPSKEIHPVSVDGTNQLSHLEQENKKLREEITTLRSDKKKIKEERDYSKKHCKELQSESSIRIKDLEKQVHQCDLENTRLIEQNKTLLQDIEIIKAARDAFSEEARLLRQQYEALSHEYSQLLERYNSLMDKYKKKVLVFSKEQFDVPSSINATVRFISPDFPLDSIDFSSFTALIALKSEIGFLTLNQLKQRLGQYLQIISTPNDLFNYLRNLED